MRAIPLLLVLLAVGPDAAPATVEVTVTGVRDATGLIRFGLYDEPGAFPDEQRYCARVFLPADPDGMVATFEGVAPGTYAVAVYHDEDESDSLQRNLVGKPKEGYGFSNGARPRLKDPPFERAAFEVPAGGTVSMTIDLTY